MLLISVGLLLAFFSSLNWLTNHGHQITVPKLMGKKVDKAIETLEDLGFRIEIDSTYKSDKSPLEVLFQEPESGMSVKYGRTIFLTVNRKTPPSIAMPNLVNMSFRNAMLTLHSYYLEIGDTNYRPDVAAGAILEQWVNGKPILPGTMVPFGTHIDLVVGEGLSGEIEVPNLIGLSWSETKTLLDSLALTANPIWEGAITDSNSAIIYMQQPESVNELDFKNSLPMGDMVDIRIMQNPSQELLDQNQPGSQRLTGDGEDTNQVSNDSPELKKVKEDSVKKPKILKGMNVHNPIVDPKAAKNNKSTTDKNKTTNSVSTTKNPKPAKPAVKTGSSDKKPEPVKKTPTKTNDDISNDYN
ncbi:MAG: PASTA domain-containing protein [Bacteroidetes bacterium]|nr:PASTA domain-containing protein [Bacteroidota bacterium]